jgi:ABC-type Fe3+/spermidine/putrescine transport system ATPase subunit
MKLKTHEGILMEDVISLEHVNKTLGQREILKDVTMSVKHGDIFGYLGPNGAGKTTTIRVILGLFKATSGKVTVLGEDVQVDIVPTAPEIRSAATPKVCASGWLWPGLWSPIRKYWSWMNLLPESIPPGRSKFAS